MTIHGGRKFTWVLLLGGMQRQFFFSEKKSGFQTKVQFLSQERSWFRVRMIKDQKITTFTPNAGFSNLVADSNQVLVGGFVCKGQAWLMFLGSPKGCQNTPGLSLGLMQRQKEKTNISSFNELSMAIINPFLLK